MQKKEVIMSLLDTIMLLIEANKQYLQDKENNELREKKNKLRYYFLLSLKNSPEKSVVVKKYLESILKNMKKRNILNSEYKFIESLHNKVEITYLKSLKDLTLNQKKTFFSRNFKYLLYKKSDNINKTLINLSM